MAKHKIRTSETIDKPKSRQFMQGQNLFGHNKPTELLKAKARCKVTHVLTKIK